MKSFIILCLLALALTASGCTVVMALMDGPGVDVRGVKPGADKPSVEKIIGQPLREWTTLENVHYSVYSYESERPGSVGNAAAMAILDAFSLGLFEFMYMVGILAETGEYRLFGLTKQMAVAYDHNGSVVGVFDDFSDFDELPASGGPRDKECPRHLDRVP